MNIGRLALFLDLGSLRLAPGYIDLHHHGFSGVALSTDAISAVGLPDGDKEMIAETR